MKRKEFLKRSCTLCVGIGAGLTLIELEACSHMPIYKTEVKDNTVNLPLSLFASADMQIISVKGLDYDLAVRKLKDNSYTALLMRCTHADNQLQMTGNGYTCTLHGSNYDASGAVTQGPAETPMLRYPVAVSGSELIVTINQR
jgi:Rieske Fe-S protein